ncbi:MAG: VTT domain-containing protein [Candidatus Parcubacteria bacterium]|nr:VTT domain-containing protein [Candidatus Parcubacteria bacterium]
MHSLFISSLIFWKPLGYTLTFFALMIEGDATLFAAAFLTSEGFFDIGDMLVIAIPAVIIGDIVWYFLGRNGISKFPKLKAWADNFAKPVDRHLTDRTFQTLLITKFTYGAHHAILLRAGMSRIHFRKFIKNDILAVSVWFPVIWSLGYFSSISLVFIRRSLRFAEVSLLIGLVLFFGIRYLARKRMQKDLR